MFDSTAFDLAARGRVWAVEHGLYRLGQGDDEDEPGQPEPPTLRSLK